MKIFVIGGVKIFSDVLRNEIFEIKHIYHTVIDGDYQCDKLFTPVEAFKKKIDKKLKVDAKIRDGHIYHYCVNAYNIDDESAYLALLRKILYEGEHKDDRTGVGTISSFGHQLQFDLSGGKFPLLTTKRMFLRGIIEELLFFIRGDSNNDHLTARGVHIWDGNTSREYLDKVGLERYEVGTLGAAYGHQWRHWGATYETKESDYSGRGIDQLAEVVRLIREEPTSRRIIMSAWNVSQLKEMALVPCHMMYQFNISGGRLNCMMTQRSADMFLGVPFNIASTALLTILLAKITGYEPGKIVINFGDAHIYKNHIEQVKRQLGRRPADMPYLNIKNDIKTLEDIEKMSYEDFELIDYFYHPGIIAPMAV